MYQPVCLRCFGPSPACANNANSSAVTVCRGGIRQSGKATDHIKDVLRVVGICLLSVVVKMESTRSRGDNPRRSGTPLHQLMTARPKRCETLLYPTLKPNPQRTHICPRPLGVFHHSPTSLPTPSTEIPSLSQVLVAAYMGGCNSLVGLLSLAGW